MPLRISLSKPLRLPFRRPSKDSPKEEHILAWKSRVLEGQRRLDTMETLGYKDAVEHFEAKLNSDLASKALNQDEAAGIMQVFEWFEAGRTMRDTARRDLDKFENVE